MPRRWLCLIGLACVLSGAAARAQGPPPLRKEKATLTLVSGVTAERTLRLSGEVRVRIEVTGTAPLRVEGEKSAGDANWKVEADETTPGLTDPEKNLATWRRELVFVPLQPGEHALPVPGLSYYEGDDPRRYDVDWKESPGWPVLRVLTQSGKADVQAAHDITDM